MKAKAKFDSAQLKAFFLHHVEKIVFGGFVVAFLLICWSAFKLKPYDKTPDQLKGLADKVSQEVEASAPPDKFADLPSVPNFNNLGAVGPAPVDPRFYAVRPMSLPYELRQASRKEPKFYALEELLGFAGYGGIAINEEGGAQRMATFGSGGMGTDGMSSGSDGMMPGSGGMMSGSDGMMNGPGSGGMSSGAGGMMGSPGGMQGSGGMSSGPGGMMGSPGGMMGGSGGMMGGKGGMMGGKGNKRAQAQAEKERKSQEAEKKKEVAPVVRRPKPQSTEKIVITQPPSGAHVEGRYWVCLVGAVPYWKQLGDYQDAFRDSRFYDVKRDFPKYSFPIIERAEINGGKQGEWQALDVEAALEDYRKWAVAYPEVVDPRFFNPDLTWPLPPLVFANHDKQKVNHPRTTTVENAKAADADSGPKKKAKPRSLSSATGRSKGGGQRGMSPGSSSGGMASGSSGGADPYAGMGGSGMGGSGMGGSGMSGSGMYGSGRGGAASRRAGPVVEHRLFRFFDFDVLPGKTYRYRIKLVLSNPNADVPARFLESYDFGKGATREADWSPPSPDVTVIAGNRLLAGNVTVTPGKSEPTARILAKLFDADEAAEIRRVFDVPRGSVLNQQEIEVGLPDPGNTKGTRSATIDFETNAVVLDLFGGEKLPGVRSSASGASAKVPGHILVLDNDGEIKALLQANDVGVFETEEEEAKNQAPPEKKEAAANAIGGSNVDGFNNFDSLDTSKKKPRGR